MEDTVWVDVWPSRSTNVHLVRAASPPGMRRQSRVPRGCATTDAMAELPQGGGTSKERYDRHESIARIGSMSSHEEAPGAKADGRHAVGGPMDLERHRRRNLALYILESRHFT